MLARKWTCRFSCIEGGHVGNTDRHVDSGHVDSAAL